MSERNTQTKSHKIGTFSVKAPPSDQIIEKSYMNWRIRYWRNKEMDNMIQPFLTPDCAAYRPAKDKNRIGWIQKAREALMLSGNEVARRLKITRSAYAKLEKNEITGSMTLQSLSKVAEAMNCELVYALRPKKRVPYSKVVWEQLAPQVQKHPQSQNIEVDFKPELRQANILARIAQDLVENKIVRRRNRWTQRKLNSAF